jgi:hypothetical protein
MQEIKIDENMRELVGIIDLMPGIFVSSCCGGHINPTKGQNEDGTFNITFSVEFNKKGRKSLGILTWVIQEACYFIYEEM